MRRRRESGESVNTNQIDYFLKAYDERSYTAAAKLVPMSAQGLTKAVHALEGELGVPLFKSAEGGRVEPTPYAEEFRAFCLEYCDARERLRAAFRRLDGQAAETIHLAVAIGSLSLLGMDLISGFRKEHDAVEICCDDLPDLKVEDALREGSDTLGITVLPTGEGLETVSLASCERYVWVAADDPLATRREVGIRDLEGRSVALVGPLFKNYGILLDALEREGVRIADLTTLSEMTWLHQFAKSGSGVAFTARSVLPLYEDDPSVVALLFRDMPYEVGVSWLATHRLSEAEEAFVEACRARRDEFAAEAARGGRRPGMGGLVGDLVRRFAGGRGSAR